MERSQEFATLRNCPQRLRVLGQGEGEAGARPCCQPLLGFLALALPHRDG